MLKVTRYLQMVYKSRYNVIVLYKTSSFICCFIQHSPDKKYTEYLIAVCRIHLLHYLCHIMPMQYHNKCHYVFFPSSHINFSQDLVLMMVTQTESICYSKDSLDGFRCGLCRGQSMHENDVSCSQTTLAI